MRLRHFAYALLGALTIASVTGVLARDPVELYEAPPAPEIEMKWTRIEQSWRDADEMQRWEVWWVQVPAHWPTEVDGALRVTGEESDVR